ncbi:hypothetical protein [Paenibacillus hamazuiensis]|uniref:hypothetical protein n=1 Tax=Paenibacillus hamazuiensis TaxID=2936508 RepID=UPI00200C9D95|nr:hypothetical protein [Paenibacillus hamazuiensis]
MSDEQNQQPAAAEPRKISLAEAMKMKLEQKKQAQASDPSGNKLRGGNSAVMKSQNNKKPNNQRRRTGGS